MAKLTPAILRQPHGARHYTEQHYLPAAAAFRKRAADKGAVGQQVVDWQQA